MRKLKLYLISASLICILSACGGSSDSTTTEENTTTAETTVAETTMAETTTIAVSEETTEVEVETTTDTGQVNDNVDTAAVYEYFNNLLISSDHPGNQPIGNEDMDVNSQEWKDKAIEWQKKCEAYEQKAMEDTAAKFGITPEEVEQIFYDNMLGSESEKPIVTIKYGDLVDVNMTDPNGIVIKAKISPSYNNKATIEQNYFNVEDFILNQGGSQYDTIDYWAVADMVDGSEGKVISFTVNKDLIQAISEKKIVAIQFGDYVEELYILPSLLK